MEMFNAPQQFWGVHDLTEEIRMLKAAHFEHAERLTQHSERIGRLEQQQDDSKIRSLWSTPSPFPPMLSSGSFSQQPVNSEPADDFNGFDEENLLADLRLDDVDVPRRGASRANSVRFDSAIQSHWIHDSQSSNDYFGPRNNSGIGGGGYPMTERSSSHKSDYKSDGRQSSMRSYGDNSSFFEGDTGVHFHPPPQNFDILDCDAHRPSAPTTGPAPAIVRCWLDTASSFDSLLYAVVCTGSVKSLVDASLVTRFGLQDQMVKGKDGEYKISLAIYLPDATIQQPTRGNGQTQLPKLTVQFTVAPSRKSSQMENEVGIFLGSDVLSDHMGDVLFSQSQLLLYVDDGRKMFVPFARPGSQAGVSDVCTIHIGDQLSEHRLEEQLLIENQKQGSATRVGCMDGPSKGESSELAIEEPTVRGQIPVSSPKPVRGRKAAVISSVSPPESSETLEEPSKKDNHRRNSIHHSGGNGFEKKRAIGHKEELTVGFGFSSEAGASSNEETTKESRYTDRRAKSDGEGSFWNANSIKSGGAGSGNGNAKGTVGVWESWRKGQMTQKKDSQAPSRGMKVLRTSKSSSLSDARASHKSEGSGVVADEPDSANPTTAHTSQGFARIDSSLSANGTSTLEKTHVRSQRRTSSAEVQPSFSMGNPALIPKPKSTNVIGGASAFHWMASKSSTSAVE
ncbi:hypothetical protein P167DRAFT_567626 [Morchella conica CCBAS932]|uniref:Ubiquitin carboxyl-terminal hydrolase 19 n=2 Tax=Morchella sect. Distantes TaxID=1051054 RepID=A0A3N4KEL0_9PEZI|nr:hypothetical protein P167DRAFT_567626 [Morchella conica CCBAS932]